MIVAGLSAGVDSHTAPADSNRDRGGERAVRTSSGTAAQRSETRRVTPVRDDSAGAAQRERTDLRSRSGDARARGGALAPRGQAPAAQGKPASGGHQGATRVGANVDAGGGGVPQAVKEHTGGATGDTGAGRRIRIEIQVPQVELPTAGPQGGSLQPEQVVGNTVQTVEQTAGAVQQTVGGATGAVQQTVGGATDAVEQTAGNVTGALPLQP